ncbi:MAG: DUF1573 domain-containing protein [Bacteroidota bacterium]
MPRLYLIIAITLFCNIAFGQSKINAYIKSADEKHQKGDYYYAVELYQKALAIDSNSVELLWKYAESLKAFKDYRKAEYYYQKVYEKEGTSIYSYSLLNVGLMQKQNGKYDEAIETFKKAKKKYAKQKKDYPYIKSKRELESCLWAKSALKDTTDLNFFRLPATINTTDSEFGHSIHNGQFIFSSLRSDSVNASEEVYSKNYHTRLYNSAMKEGKFEDGKKLDDLFYEKLNTGNGTFSLDGKRFYFSLCEEESYNYRCKIMVARYENGKWSGADSLGEIINEAGSNTTMPCIGELEGNEVLFFSSNREDSEGGLDLYYSIIKNGNQFGKVKAIKNINSIDNDISPWWDGKQKKLYFSSSWHDGFGGHDVFYSQFSTQFEEPINVGLPINSSANDLYYFKASDTSYVSSNRMGVLFAKNPTCCSDVFSGIPPIKLDPPTKKETLAELNKRLPVTLYFHNDCPDPKTWDTLTKVNYLLGYNDYREMLEKYQQEYSSGLSTEKAEEAKEDIESFFIEYVDQGVKDMFLFRDLLLEELQKGAQIKVTIKGFASPLHKTDYNVNLTKRRISSFINYLKSYNNGVFVPYFDGKALNGGKLVFQGAPFGEYTANTLTSDNFHDQKNSVYSRAAAIERKVEIQSVSYLDDRKIFPLRCEQPVYDAFKVKAGEEIEATFEIVNESKETVQLNDPTTPFTFLKTEIAAKQLAPGEKTQIKVHFNTEGFAGKNMKFIEIGMQGYEETIKLIVTSEIE